MTDILLILILALISAVAFYRILAKLGVIKNVKSISIIHVDPLAEFMLIKNAHVNVRIVSKVLHHSLFTRRDVLEGFRRANIPIDIIFGPRLDWGSYPFIKVFKENANIRLFQIREELCEDLNQRQKVEINRLTMNSFTLVDGTHCYIESPHREDDMHGGTEWMHNPILCARLEADFEKLLMRSIEVDRMCVVDSVGNDNVYLVGKNGTWRGASLTEIQSLKKSLDEQK